MKKLFSSVSLIVLLACAALAQATSWTRLESDAKDFSVAIPSQFQVMTDKKGYEMVEILPNGIKDVKDIKDIKNFKTIKLKDIRYIMAFENGASFLIENYKVENMNGALNSLYPNVPANTKIGVVDSDGFTGRVIPTQNENSYSLEIIVGYKDHVYRIFGGARDRTNETLVHFFSTIQFNGKKFFEANPALSGQIKETPAAISGLSDTPFELVDEKKNEAGDAKIEKPTEIIKTDEARKLIVLRKPVARYTDEARDAKVTGTVKLWVYFGENGAIEKIEVLSGLPQGLTEKAVRAARVIRFVPQEKDDKFLPAAKTVLYSFSIY